MCTEIKLFCHRYQYILSKPKVLVVLRVSHFLSPKLRLFTSRNFLKRKEMWWLIGNAPDN